MRKLILITTKEELDSYWAHIQQMEFLVVHGKSLEDVKERMKGLLDIFIKEISIAELEIKLVEQEPL